MQRSIKVFCSLFTAAFLVSFAYAIDTSGNQFLHPRFLDEAELKGCEKGKELGFKDAKEKKMNPNRVNMLDYEAPRAFKHRERRVLRELFIASAEKCYISAFINGHITERSAADRFLFFSNFS